MYSIKTKLLAIFLILLSSMAAAFAIYSTIITTSYRRQRLDGIRKLVELKAERANKAFSDSGQSTINLDELLLSLSDIKPTENSIFLLYDSESDMIMSNTFIYIDFFNRVIPVHTAMGRINELIYSTSRTWQSDYNITASFVFINGIEYLSLNKVMENDWYLLVYAPVDELFLETDRLNTQFTMILLIIMMIILCLAYFLVSKIIYKPIRKLITGVTRVSLNNLDMRVDIVSNDELGIFARAFNKMTADLQESIEIYTKTYAEKERISSELNIAAEIQAGILPCIFPAFPDRTEFDLYATMHPAKEVGGDFYDFFMIDKDNLVVIIADVSGKGVPAALFMVITKTLISNKAFSSTSPCEVFDAVNKMLCENNEAAMFVTAFIGYYNIPSGRLNFVNAGHNPPLIKKPGKNYSFLRTEPCSILGWENDAEYREEEILLEPGDLLYLYTDGVTEAMNDDGHLFTEERLLEVLNEALHLQPRELLPFIKEQLEYFSEGAEKADDITMLALEIKH